MLTVWQLKLWEGEIDWPKNHMRGWVGVGVGVGRVSGILPHCGVALSSTYTLQNAGAHYLTIFISFFIARVIVSCSSPWQIRVHLERERLPQWPHIGHLPRCGLREGALFLPVLHRPPTRSPPTHTPAALGTSPLLTAVSSKDRYTAEGPPPQRGSWLTSRGYIWAACCWRGGSTFCQPLAYMSSLSQSMVFTVWKAG